MSWTMDINFRNLAFEHERDANLEFQQFPFNILLAEVNCCNHLNVRIESEEHPGAFTSTALLQDH